ncbi:oligopeptide:H+ symporter [Spongiactinospora sp. TRM90649]|uniref:peptide MFS transporter n=1 Tax=Spongiactinospora sp. TRM90649 TaxID=3031114 RepID=UPI0023F7BD13|nr:oligopeptide:H+ symporter [Spongiactinospora sp. TRM90649]MDF5753759.1 oligopeptide:H+ symporter [Spongiactinospora sp. TRM90649]
MTSGVTSGTCSANRDFFGHPRGLATLFGTEMWERFSYYGLRSILVLFMVASPVMGGLGLPEATAIGVVGIYGSLVYLLALPGGWIADRILGPRRSVLTGGVTIMLGHISMAVPVEGAALIWLGLGLIVAGTGLLKPNISCMVGQLYPRDDAARRDAGFSIFYFGINLGAFIAPFVVGDRLAAGNRWHLGFGAAAVGMAIGLVWYIHGYRHLGDAGSEPGHRLTPEERAAFGRLAGGAAAVTAAGAALWAVSGTFTLDRLTLVLTVVVIAVPVAYFAYILLGEHGLAPEERARMRAYIWLFAAAAVFWMIYDLAPSVLNLFAQHKTTLSLFGVDIQAATTQAINPLFILIFSPLFAVLWVRLGDRVAAPVKFAFALVMIGLSFVLMAVAAGLAETARVSVWWLVAVYLVQVFGELALSPVGLSVTSQLAPRAFQSQMLGVWFLSTAVGDAVGGQTGRLLAHMSQQAYFLTLAAVAVCAGAVLFGCARRLHGLMSPAAVTAPE